MAKPRRGLGSAQAPPATQVGADQFPEFTGGDVRIYITSGRQYLLHASILRANSVKFRTDLLFVEDAVKLNNRAVRKGVTNVYKLRLYQNSRSLTGYVLRQMTLDNDGREKVGVLDLDPQDKPISAELERNENGRAVDPILLAFDWVLGSFYNQPIVLGDPSTDSLMELLQISMTVVDVAEYLGCVHLVRLSIETTFLKIGQNLYRSISANPAAWLNFAFRIQSKTIFREAMIHAVGKYQFPEIQAALNEKVVKPPVKALLRSMGNAIREGVTKAERMINSNYPANLQREMTVGLISRDNIGRSSYSNDILSWVAVTAFRHWFSDHVFNGEGHESPDMGFQLFSCLAKGGDKYLSKGAMKDFHARFPMSRKAMAAVEHRLGEHKETIKQFVKHHMVNNSMLDIRSLSESERDHFTCANVGRIEFPWKENVFAVYDDEDEAPVGQDAEIERNEDDEDDVGDSMDDADDEDDSMDDADDEDDPMDDLESILYPNEEDDEEASYAPVGAVSEADEYDEDAPAEHTHSSSGPAGETAGAASWGRIRIPADFETAAAFYVPN